MGINKRVLEALQMQPLSNEEKASRHILGRLYGPISTWSDSTRNDRFYSKPLWIKAINDEIFKEKIANKSLFLELGHPIDREETDMTKVCACIPELPKVVDNDLCAYVDILDTPNGRLLKTLIDYGFVPGISSRGSGDVDDDNAVDPNTFFLETWDIVPLPAVKKARLNVCESFGPKKTKLTQAIVESLNSANEEDRKIMKETLNKLDIKLMEDAGLLPGGTPTDINKIPMGEEDQEENKILTEKAEEPQIEEEEEEIKAEVEESPVETEESPVEAEEEPKEEEDPEEEEIKEEDPKEAEEEVKEEEQEEVEDEVKEEEEQEETEEEIETENQTVGDIIKKLKKFDKEAPVEIAPIEINGTQYIVKLTDIEESEDTENIKIGVDCQPVDGDSENIEEPNVEEIPAEEPIVDEIPVEPEAKEISAEEIEAAEEPVSEEPEVAEEEAIDDGDDEVIESLKEMIRQKDALEKEVKTLKNEKSVGDAKETELKEELTKYKTAFARVSELAAKATKYEVTVKELTEQVTQKNSKIVDLQAKVLKSEKLTEGIQKDNLNVKILTEKLTTLQKQSEEAEQTLKEELENCTKKLNNRTIIAKKYIAKYNEAVEKYVKSKASMLGVKPTEITSKLNENYTMDDIDKICDDLLTSTVSISRLPFGRTSKVTINESKSVNKLDPDNGYDIDDSLYELAGLK